MESGIGSAQEAVASPVISRRFSCPWSLCYTRCYTQAAVSTSQPPGIPISTAMSGGVPRLVPGKPMTEDGYTSC